MLVRNVSEGIDSEAHPLCPLCGAQGRLLYSGLRDRLFNAPGTWNLKKCYNPQCRLAWLDPMPKEKDLGKAYQNYYTHTELQAYQAELRENFRQRMIRSIRESYLSWKFGYAPRKLGFFKTRLWPLAYLGINARAWLDSKVAYLHAPYEGRLLEVGAGSGEQLKQLIDFGWDGEGLDNDAIAAETAKRKGLNVRCGTIESQQYPNSVFDVIVMNHVIEHVHDPHSLLRECYRILKPQGRLVIVTPNILSLCHRIFKASWFPLDPPRHLRLYSPAALKRLLGEAGFTKNKIFTTTRNANGVFWGSRSIQLSGRYEMNTKPAFFSRLLGWFVQVIELLLLNINPQLGEEITVIARKN